MFVSLTKLATLPPPTRVFCGHEYTVQNLRFAAAVEPENAAVSNRRAEAEKLRAAGEPTVPSTIAAELDTNPFLRAKHPAVRRAVSERESIANPAPEQTFAALRRWKDRF
jgi:hydroxyacylglutathione hydrolase